MRIGYRGLVCMLAVWLLAGVGCMEAQAQQKNANWDVGFGLGLSGFTGDLNFAPLPQTISGHAQGLIRYNLSPMYALRAGLQVGGLNAIYYPGRYYLPGGPTGNKRYFHTPMLAVDAGVDIHFLPFVINSLTGGKVNPNAMTPYVTVGLGGMVVFNNGGGFYIPMGGGVKFALFDRFTLAGELRFLKGFFDTADRYKNWPKSTKGHHLHNQDWVSMLTVSLTYRFVVEGHVCPAYQTK